MHDKVREEAGMNMVAERGLSVELFCTPHSGCNQARDTSFVVRVDELADDTVTVTTCALDGGDEHVVIYPRSEAGGAFLADLIERAAMPGYTSVSAAS
jgi:hypothetical protein